MRIQKININTHTWTLVVFTLFLLFPYQQASAVFHHVDGCMSCHDFYNFGSSNLRLIYAVLETPNSGPRQVVLTATTGVNSLADGDNVYDGICEVCHTQTRHHTNDGHDNTAHYDGELCTQCHSHGDQFSAPYGPSHYIHVDQENMACADCHTDPMQHSPTIFADGQTLESTTVCGSCHLQTGPYDGVNDPVIGAKTNWNDGVYDNNQNLKPGKENWCSGCHVQTNHFDTPQCAECHRHGTGFVGTFAISHNIHINDENMLCTDCHSDPLSFNPTLFADGLSLASTSVCGNCHDSGGTVDSVNDPVIGAKSNWSTGVYDADRSLLPGKEDWCLGCHVMTNHYIEVPCAQCHLHGSVPGAFQVKSHDMHVNNGNMTCAHCHADPFQFNPTLFSDGQSLADTTVCNNCHDPDGAYDGVNDPVIGGKNNWSDGVYDASGRLLPGKETWCLGCHDKRASSHAKNSTGKVCQDCHSRRPFHMRIRNRSRG